MALWRNVPAVSTALGSWSGNTPAGPNRDAILLGRRHHALNAKLEELAQITEIGSYPANPCPMTCRAMWNGVEDRWHENYNGFLHDGSAWTEEVIPAG